MHKVPTHNHSAKQIVITMPEPTPAMTKAFGQVAKVAIATAMKSKLHSIGFVTKQDGSGAQVIVGTIASSAPKGKITYKLVRYEGGHFVRQDIGGLHQTSIDYLAQAEGSVKDEWIIDSDLIITLGRILTPTRS